MKRKKEYLTTGELIRMHRRKCGMSQRELAQLTGKECKAISLYENGKRKPNRDSLFKISKALGVDPSELRDSRLQELVSKRPESVYPQDVRLAIAEDLKPLPIEILLCIHRAVRGVVQDFKENHVDD